MCQGLSLNDSYWVVQENCKDLFKDKNLETRLKLKEMRSFDGFVQNHYSV